MATRTAARMVKKRNGAGLAGALISAGIVAAAIIVTSQQRPAPLARPAVVAEFDTVNVLVPSQPVTAGTKVRDIHFKNVSFPRHQVPAGAVTDVSPYADAIAVAALPAGLPLFPANFSTVAHVSNPVLERIPPGMRAMTIKVDATSSVEGWAGSGSTVDVLLIEKNRTSVVAEKVKILSAERSVSPVEGSNPNVPSTVTVLVTQEQCLAINTAVPLGKIAFALRSNRDDESWTDTSFTADRLKGVPSAEKPESSVSGYVEVKDANSKAFALSNGKWIHTEVVPEGFLVGKQ